MLTGTEDVLGTFFNDAASSPTTKELLLQPAVGLPSSLGSKFRTGVLDTAGFADGTYSIVARATDSLGNSDSTTVTGLIIDNTPPDFVALHRASRPGACQRDGEP